MWNGGIGDGEWGMKDEGRAGVSRMRQGWEGTSRKRSENDIARIQSPSLAGKKFQHDLYSLGIVFLQFCHSRSQMTFHCVRYSRDWRLEQTENRNENKFYNMEATVKTHKIISFVSVIHVVTQVHCVTIHQNVCVGGYFRC